MKREKRTIPKQKANRNEEVMVSNYRRNGLWQEGKVVGIEYKDSFGDWDWSYDVSVIGKNGSYYRLYVGDDRLMSMKEWKERSSHNTRESKEGEE